MKKFNLITKKFILFFMGIVAVNAILMSCEEEEDQIWNDNEAPTLMSISPTSAMVGGEVTITGKYFSSKANNTVTFNGIDATIVAANISIIKAVMPEGATSGDIVVTSDGLVSTNGLTYTVIEPIIPTITSIDPTSGKVGETVIITGIDFSTTPEDNEVRFNGVQASVTASTATTITTIVPSGATTGNITVTRDGDSNGFLFTVSVSYTFIVQISAEEDDVEEGGNNGAMAFESSDLELGEYDTWTQYDTWLQEDVAQGLQTIGLKFNAIDIPVGSTILSASIQFTCDAVGADPAEMTIYGEDVGNAAPFEQTAYNITNRQRTVENAVWDIPEWVATGDQGLAQQTPQLGSIVQAIVNREDWGSGNSMVFILAPSGDTLEEESSSGGREAEAGPGFDAAILTIIYE